MTKNSWESDRGDRYLVAATVTDVSTLSRQVPVCGQSIPIANAISRPLGDLRALTSIADIAHTLNPGDTYSIITDHKDVWLRQRDPVTGEYPSLPRGEKGQILEHPKWKRLGVDAVKAVKIIGSQILLVHMAIRLEHISTRAEHLVDRLHDNNVAELEGCVRSLMAGIALKDLDSKRQRLENVAHDLHKAISVNVKMLQQEIHDCSKAETGFLDAWCSDGLRDAQQKMARAQRTACALFQGIVGIYYAYILRPEPEYDVAEKEVQDLICLVLSSVDIVEAHNKTALAAGGKSNVISSLFWNDLYGCLDFFLKTVSGEKKMEIIVPYNALFEDNL